MGLRTRAYSSLAVRARVVKAGSKGASGPGFLGHTGQFGNEQRARAVKSDRDRCSRAEVCTDNVREGTQG
jgi:hypothetical protein